MFYSSVSPDAFLNQFQEGARLKTESYRGRFAPSPTGSLHIGNLRTALISWISARINNGVWLLRFDDLDQLRNKSHAVESIKRDLIWLGLYWDEPEISQQSRIDIYKNTLSFLNQQGKLYACRCSRSQLTRRAIISEQSIYPGTCRGLGLNMNLNEGKVPSWRLKVKPKYAERTGDIILKRADGFISYHLATVVDELTLGITEVVRGNDLKDAMFAQIAITEALNQSACHYKHLPVFFDKNGKKFSKRDGGKGIAYFQENNMNSSQVIGWLASTLELVPVGSNLSALELLSELKNDRRLLDKVFI